MSRISMKDWLCPSFNINDFTQCQDSIFFSLSSAYGILSAVALIQLIRIQLRVPEYGWTTQKLFHLMKFIVNGVRAVVFGFHMFAFTLQPKVLTWVLLDLPSLLFFSTYMLLVFFWAELYYQIKGLSTSKLRAVYIAVNCVIYVTQFFIWIYLWVDDSNVVQAIGQLFITVVSFVGALGFLVYGGRLFIMLHRFPIKSKVQSKKLHEVGSVTAICVTCFLIRCLWLQFLHSTQMHLSTFWITRPSISFTTCWLKSCPRHSFSSFCTSCPQKECQLRNTRSAKHIPSSFPLVSV